MPYFVMEEEVEEDGVRLGSLALDLLEVA